MIPARFEPIRTLGRGGMGEVDLARDRHTGELVAVKRLLPGMLDADDLARFSREADALRACGHPAIVRLVAWGTEGGTPWLAMEHLPGGTLHDRVVRQGPLPEREVARIGAALAGALAYAHQAGVIHRDLKPENVLLDEQGQPRLVDFGLARSVAHGGSLTATGAMVGTPGWAAPEVIVRGGREATPAVDAWGLGATLYFLLCGVQPFSGETLLAMVDSVVARPPVPVAERAPGVDPALATAIERCLEKDPARRPSLPMLAAALGRLAAAREGVAPRRGGRTGLVAGLLVLAGSGAAAALMLFGRGAPPTPAPAPAPAVAAGSSQGPAEPARPQEPMQRAALVLILEKALDLGRKQHPFRGLGLVETVLAKDPGLEEARLVRLCLRARVGDAKGAREDLRAWRDGAGAAKPELLQAAAEGLFSLGERAAALELVDLSLAARPEDPALHLLRARLLLERGDRSGALASALLADRLGRDGVEPRLLCARLRLDQGDAAGARGDAEAALRRALGHVGAELLCGLAALAEADPPGHARGRAAFDATRGEELDPEQRWLRGRLARALGERDEAARELRRALEAVAPPAEAVEELRALAASMPGRAGDEALATELRAAAAAGRAKEVEEAARELLVRAPDSVAALEALGAAAEARFELELAVSHLRPAVALEPGAPRLLARLANCEGMLDRNLPVVVLLADLPPPTGDPDLNRAWLHRANAHLGCDDPQGAAAAAERVVALDPENKDALSTRLMGWAHARDPRALPEADRMIARWPESHLLVQRSGIRAGLGDLAGALADSELAITRARNQAQRALGLRSRAWARSNLGDQAGAWEDLGTLESLGYGGMVRPLRAELERRSARPQRGR